MKEIYTIELDRPKGVTTPQLISYITEAIEVWGGQRRPGDPLFYPWNWGRGPGDPDKLPPIRVRRRYP